MKQVAIIIPTMDNHAYLDGCIESLLDNTEGVSYHIYVINNGAVGSCDWLDHPTIDVLDANENLGWERGIELGIKHSSEPLILLLNDDVFFPHTGKQWLARMVADLDDPQVAAAGPSSNTVAGPQSSTWPLPAPRYVARYLIGFCMLVRRLALITVGGIDTTLPGGDDIDLSIRLREAGYTLVCDRTSFVYHYGFKTGIRVHGDHTRPGGWNSQEMIGATTKALVAKHGQAAFADAWRNDPLGEYHAPVPVGNG